MSMCRNELMNKGMPYPKSSCGVCGSILGNAICKMNVHPSPPIGSGLRPEHYVEVPSTVSADKYAVVVEESWQEGDTYGDYTTVSRDVFKHFEDEKQLKEWYKQNQIEQYSRHKVKKVIRYQELTVSTEVIVNVG